jgi:putative ABC transport system permease protein
MRRWLEGFAYHIRLNIWIFAFYLILTLFIALITVSHQALRAALANPVDSLKNE